MGEYRSDYCGGDWRRDLRKAHLLARATWLASLRKKARR